MLATKNRKPTAIINAPIVEMKFNNHQPSDGIYVYKRRGIPSKPRMNCGKKHTLNPIMNNQNAHLFNFSFNL